MKFGHAPYPRHAPHIEVAFERATIEKADGVLSGFQLTPRTGKETALELASFLAVKAFQMRHRCGQAASNPLLGI